MHNSIPVTLDPHALTLIVPDADIDPDPHQEPQLIKWYRNDPKIAQGIFLFAWEVPPGPPAGVFGTFENIYGTPWATMADLLAWT